MIPKAVIEEIFGAPAFRIAHQSSPFVFKGFYELDDDDLVESVGEQYRRRRFTLAETVHGFIRSGKSIINLRGEELTDDELIGTVLPLIEDEPLSSPRIGLDLSCNNLTPLCARELARRLNRICETKKVALVELHLNGNKLDDAAIKDLCCELSPSVIASIENLALGASERMSDESACAIGKHLLPRAPSLRCLSLKSARITDRGVQGLVEGLSSGKDSALSSLHLIALDGNYIGDVGVEAIAAVLPKMPRIKKLSLASNPVGDAGVRALSKALQHAPGDTVARHRTLLDLSLGGCMKVTDEGVKSLIPAIQQSDLVKINVGFTSCNYETAHALSKLVAHKLSKRSKTLQAMLAAREIHRVGKGSQLNSLPKELIRRVGDYLPQFEEGESVPRPNPFIGNGDVNAPIMFTMALTAINALASAALAQEVPPEST